VLAAENRQLIGLRADLGPKGFGPGADVDRLLSRLDKAIEAAAGLHAPLLCIDAGPLPEPPAEAKPTPQVTPGMAGLIILPPPIAAPAPPRASMPTRLDETLASHVDAALYELGRRADRYGVTVALRSDLASYAALDRALRAASCPWFGIELDPVAVLRDQWSLDETLSRVGDFVRHVRGRDGIVGSGQRTTPAIIGRGSTDWAMLLAALDAAGYAGWITIDPLELPDRSAAAAAGLAQLRSL
jgi:sugar phosphate isomerase/epimerase